MAVMSRICLLTVVMSAVAGCAGAPPPDDPPDDTAAPRPAPTRELVVWVDSLCQSISSWERLKESSARDVAEITEPGGWDPRRPDERADSFLFSASAQLTRLAESLSEPASSGIPAADKVRAAYAAAVEAVEPEVERLDDPSVRHQRVPEQRIQDALRAGELIASMTPPQPDLPAVVAAEPTLADAYHLAPRCSPDRLPNSTATPSSGPTPTSAVLPPAADGTDLSACADGACQILVTGQMDVSVRGQLLHVSLDEGGVTIGKPGANGAYAQSTMAVGGSTRFGSPDDTQIAVTVDGRNADGAVLTISPG
jgi:hypothetical protein